MKTKDTKCDKNISGKMGDSVRHGVSSADVNKQDLGKSYKTGKKIDNKRDKMTDRPRKLSRE